MNLDELIKSGEAADWCTEESLKTLEGGYLLPGETPRGMYRRLASGAAKILKKPELEEKFFELFWKNWLGPASPVCSNFNTNRNLPISCYSVYSPDSITGIMNTQHELAVMSKYGGGVGVHYNGVRGRGSPIGTNNGVSDGVVPFIKIQDSVTIGVAQGCYDDKTELLTNKGWKLFKELQSKDFVAQVNENRTIEFVHPKEIISYHVDEDLYKFVGSDRNVNLLVTANHRMVYESHWAPGNRSRKKTWDGKLRTKRADEIKFHTDNCLHGSGTAIGKESILSNEERFLIAYQADGIKNSYLRQDGTYLVYFRFFKQRKIDRLSKIVANLGLKYDVYKQNDGTTSISIKQVPPVLVKETLEWVDLKNKNATWAQSFVEEVSNWDGSKRKNSSTKYTSINKLNVDILQAVCAIANLRSNLYITEAKDNRKTKYNLHITQYRKYCGDNVIKTTERYAGNVYCCTVPSGILVVRRNNGVVLCGNSQRRGATAAYLPIDHPDIEEFLRIRRPQGDPNRQCLNIHHGVCVDDAFIAKVDNGDEQARDLWKEILKARYETGEPYLFFSDTVNKQNPEVYKKNGLSVKGSNICCVSGDTLVLTKQGSKRIDELCGREVEIWDGNTWVLNNTFAKRGIDKLYRITIADGSYVDCNANHRWFVARTANDNFVGNYAEVLTKNLKTGDWIEPNFFNAREDLYWNRFLSIEELPGEHPVYCPTLPTTGKFGLANGLMTGNTEIMLHTDEDHSFVCCLSSMNLARWDEWKNTDAVQLSIWFLDAVMEEFIQKASAIPGFERAVRFAVKSRALGLGALGWHSLLQQKGLPFDSFETYKLNNQIFKHIHNESEKASRDLALEYGEPEWCKGFGVRNSHRCALAPTVSNAVISGNVSQSIEPWTANAYARKTAKGTFTHKNKELVKVFDSIGKNTQEVWNSIVSNNGSVQHLDFLTPEQKEVFLTAREINQFVLVKLAEQRQRWIDQGQSLNLFFPSNVDPKYFHEVHWYAAKSGIIKTLYYCRTESVLKGDSGSRVYERKIDECLSCSG